LDFRAQVVGWPPVRSYRKNVMAQKNASEEGEKASTGGSSAAFVKVCMDGAPYLRKVDLKMYRSYQELSDALAKMFSSFTMGECDYIYILAISHDELIKRKGFNTLNWIDLINIIDPIIIVKVLFCR